MEHSAKLNKTKPRGGTERFACRAMPGLLIVPLAFALAGCSGQSGPFSMFHGLTAKPPPPPPGLAAPFPHLSSVPAKPTTISVADQQQIRARLEAANQAGQAKLAPAPAPPPGPSSAAVPVPQAPAQAGRRLLIGFPSGSAIVPHAQRALLRRIVQQRGASSAILAAGFAPATDAAGLQLALHRALAIADQLTDAGLPLADIRLAALAAGHGGFAELLYDAPSHPEPVTVPPSKDQPSKDHPKDRS